MESERIEVPAGSFVKQSDGRFAFEPKGFCPTGPGGGIDNSCSPNRSISTNTPAFKAWFGDSKVVDEKGNPKEQYGSAQPVTVYHGTNADFSVFDPRKIGANATEAGKGFYFAENQGIASSFVDEEGGRVVEAYLSIKKPLDFDAMLDEGDVADWEVPSMLVGRYQQSVARLAQNGKLSGFDAWKNLQSYTGDDVNGWLADSGYDGITHRAADAYGTIAPPGAGTEVSNPRIWVAFRSVQIKSTENEGTFDPQNPDITKATSAT